jgi:hypothetical protein
LAGGNACPTKHHLPSQRFQEKLELARQLSGAGVSACQPVLLIQLGQQPAVSAGEHWTAAHSVHAFVFTALPVVSEMRINMRVGIETSTKRK